MWIAPTSCKFGFVCVALSGNICGDYKIQIDNVDVCRPNVVVRGKLDPDGEISARKIPAETVVSNGTGNARCYLWCTPGGDLPSAYAEEGEPATVALIEELQTRLDQGPD